MSYFFQTLICFFLNFLDFFVCVYVAIEACRQQLSGTTTEYNLNGQQSECSEQTTSTDGPVLEEFIPIKKRASPYCEQVYDDDNDEEDDEQHSHHKQQKISMDKKKSDWLRSVQLWNPDPPSHEVITKSNLNCCFVCVFCFCVTNNELCS
jgi:hypothetical protein